MNKNERKQKAVEQEIAPEKLLKLQELCKIIGINPLLEQLEIIGKQQIIETQGKSLKEVSEKAAKKMVKQQSLYNSMHNYWMEAVLKIVTSFPTVNFPKYNFYYSKPLYDYGLCLQKIQIKYTTPKIIETFESLQSLAIEISNAKAEAENNLWHNLAVEEYEFEIEIYKEEITELKQKLIEQEEIISAYKSIVSVQQPKPKTKEPLKTLRPHITQSQIFRLYERLNGMFEATPEQWRALFSETEIKLSEPIKADAVADIALLLVQLYRNKFIKTKEYAAIIGRTKAFSFLDKKTGERILATQKNINATKERSYWWKEDKPAIGYNHNKINKAVASL